ncbi:MAG: hypothetical protein F6K14_31360, partial [Symploca sp. SIO2C1]|nr:hypothetical protein [Symploca sp. SIO2C1]
MKAIPDSSFRLLQQALPRACCISVEAMPDMVFNHFDAKQVPGFLVKCLKTLAPESGKMYRKVENTPSQPEDFEFPLSGKLSHDNRWVVMASLVSWSE